MRKFLCTTVLLVSVIMVHAQDIGDLRKMITDMLEQQAEQQQLDIDYEEMVNGLINLSLHPIDLNNTSKDELEQLIFLNDFQIENLLFYQYNNGPIISIYELQAVEGLDRETIQKVLPFVSVGVVKRVSRRFVQFQSLGRIQTTMQTPEGYISDNDTSSSAYIGSKFRWLTKAQVNFSDKTVLGFTMEKDPGEVAFQKGNTLADFNSGYIEYNPQSKLIDKVIIGDYRLSFGQGLGMWSDMAFSKSSETSQLRRRSRGLNSYSSVNERSFLRGIASQLDWKSFSLTPFYSYKNIDASLQLDSIDDFEWISSMSETGYHRTASEIAGKNQVNEQVAGANLKFKHHLFSIESGYSNWSISRPFEPEDHLKNKYRFSGKKLESLWFSPCIFLGRLNLFGELAVQNYKDWGVFQGLTYSPGSDIVISMAYRKYSNGYTALYYNPFAESSTAGGESGFFSSFQFKPHRKWTLKAYTDLFAYSWLRYNVYAPSTGFEWFAQANYRINYRNQFYIRYKSSNKEINSSEETTNYQISEYTKRNIRLYYKATLNDQWSLQTQVEQSFYNGEESSTGWMAFQDITWHSDILKFSLRYALFDVGDYNSRIYAYEPDVLYAFNIPAYQYQGGRLIANASIDMNRNWRFWMRLAHTFYNDKESIGSGYQEVEGNQLTEVKFQLQYRFMKWRD